MGTVIGVELVWCNLNALCQFVFRLTGSSPVLQIALVLPSHPPTDHVVEWELVAGGPVACGYPGRPAGRSASGDPERL